MFTCKCRRRTAGELEDSTAVLVVVVVVVVVVHWGQIYISPS